MKKNHLLNLLFIFIFFLLYIIIIPLSVSYFLRSFNINKIILELIVYFILFIIIYLRYNKNLINELKIFIKNFKSYFTILINNLFKGIILMIVFNIIISFFVSSLPNNEVLVRNELLNYFPLSIIITCLLSPFIEEIAFRKNFRVLIKNDKLFIIISSLIFSLAHVIASGTNYIEYLYIISYFSLSYYFALTYVKTNNIFSSYLMHVLHNSLSILLIILGSVIK